MSDYPLTSTWAEVDAAAQAVKNGLPKANLSGAVQASLEKADSAYQKPPDGISIYDLKSDVQQSIHRADESAQRFWVTITRENNVYSCDRTLEQIQAAYAAGKYIRANLPDGFQSDFSNNDDGAMFYVFDDSGGSMMLMCYTVGASAVTFQMWPVGGQGITEDLKVALLDWCAHTAWNDTDGPDRYDALEAALYPGPAPVTLVSITAAYDQDRPIYDTDSLDLVKLDLVVTANYSDGTSETLADDAYTLTGTLTVGTSTITVGYEGKTAEIEVVVTEAPTSQDVTISMSIARTIIDMGTGVASTNASWHASDFVEIPSGFTKLSYHNTTGGAASFRGALYDSSKTYIGNTWLTSVWTVNNNSTSEQTLPSGAKYIRLSTNLSALTSVTMTAKN